MKNCDLSVKFCVHVRNSYIMWTLLITVFVTVATSHPPECQPLWFNKCNVNADCCSSNCHRSDPNWLYGVCMTSPEQETTPNSLNEDATPPTQPQSENSTKSIEDQIDELMLSYSQPKETLLSYTKYVKGLVFSANGFTLQASSLPCTDLDPLKEMAIALPTAQENRSLDVVRLCDFCPNLPLEKLNHIQLLPVTKNLLTSRPGVSYPECVALCIGEPQCVALNYNLTSRHCSHFNSTDGDMLEARDSVFVEVSQPTWTLGNWVLSRNTRLNLREANETNYKETNLTNVSFLECLAKCEEFTGCLHVSFDQMENVCVLVLGLHGDTMDEPNVEVDYVYGYLSTFHVNAGFRSGDDAWRFDITTLSLDDIKIVTNDDKPNFITDANNKKEYDYIDNPGCKLQPMEGCDSVLGKQKCQYAENLNDSTSRLPYCPESRLGRYNVFVEEIRLREKCFSQCVSTRDCIGIQWNVVQKDNVCRFVNPSTLTDSHFLLKNYYALRHPMATTAENSSSNLSPIWKYNLNPGYKISTEQVSHYPPNWIRSSTTIDLENCLQQCVDDSECSRVSWEESGHICLMAKGPTKMAASSSSILFIKRPRVTDPAMIYSHLIQTSVGVTSNSAEIQGGFQVRVTIDQKKLSAAQNQCLEKCAEVDNSTSCDFAKISYGIQQDNILVKCKFYSESKGEILLERGDSEIFVRTGKRLSKSFGQNELDKIPFFRKEHFSSTCFKKESENAYSNFDDRLFDLESISEVKENQTTTSLSIRQRRGIFDWIKDKIFKPIANVAKNIVNDIKDTVVNTGKSIGKFFQGDLEGAKDAFLEIPIVRDVKDTVESGIQLVKNIASGENVGESLLDFGTNLAGVVPLPGAKGVKVLKNAFKPKKVGPNVSKESKDKIKPKKETKSDKERKKKDDEEKEKERDKDKGQCSTKKRTKRATGGGPKKRPANCDDDRTCTYRTTSSKTGSSVLVPNMDKKSSSSCSKVNLKAKEKQRSCNFLCKAGYSESNLKPVCRERSKDDADWVRDLKCDPSDCGTPDALQGTTNIAVKVPHPLLEKEITAFYVKYDAKRELPIYSATYHDKFNYANPRGIKLKRSNNFKVHPCPSLANKQIDTPTYKFKSPYIRGHLTPYQAIGMLGKKAGDSSFMMINIAPQETWTNSAPWGNVVEDNTYCTLFKKGPGIVITGLCPGTLPGSAPNFPKPTCFWKLVCYKEKGETIVVGFTAPNSKLTNKDQRKKETIELKSQKEIIDEVGRSGTLKFNFAQAWVQAGVELLKFREPGVSPLSCSTTLSLPPNFSAAWNKKDTKRKKREAEGLVFGCNKKDLDEFRALISSISTPDDETDSDGETDNGEDGSDGDSDDSTSSNTFPSSSCGKRLIGYYPSWGQGKFTYKQGKSLTHVVFAFFETFSDGRVALGSADSQKSTDPNADLGVSEKRLAGFLRVVKTFPHLKAMFAVGGWENSQYFSSIAADPGKRATFIASTLRIIDQYAFHGIDIDWEHPATGGAVEGTAADKGNYVTFMRELRVAMDGHSSKSGANKFFISFAGAAGQWSLDPGYDLPNLLKYADWVNVMTYDYFGAWESKWGAYTGAPAPLYFGNPKGFSGKVNVDWSIKYYVCRSKSPFQVNMGVPFYGRFWENVGDPIDPKDGMWRMATAVGGVFKGGFVPYKEIGSKYNSPDFQHSFHPEAKVPYAFSASKKIFLGYETPESLKHKVKYAEDYNLGGIMIWAIDQDDEDYSMMDTLMEANLCSGGDKMQVKHKCPPIDDKRWWTPEDGYDKAGMCGKSSPLYKGYYAVCDPDDPGYSCCGSQGYCGSGADYCDCPTCVDYRKFPEKIVEEPTKPSGPIRWFISTDPDGQRGRCGRDSPKLANGQVPICNPDDRNSHCCSNGGYCGTGDKFCTCAECIDFSKQPNYTYKEKTWWAWADGADKSGRCGATAPKLNGRSAECNPDSPSPCCSAGGWCGNGQEFCKCSGCIDYRK